MLPLYVISQEIPEETWDTARRSDPRSSQLLHYLTTGNFTDGTDSSMLFFEQYDATLKNRTSVQNLGDVHTPFTDLRFVTENRTGFVPGLTAFNGLFFGTGRARIYDSKMPYAEFSYAQGKGGQRGMIDFDALYAQNFNERSGLSMTYHSTSNDGFYTRQSQSLKNFLVTAHTGSKNKRYQAVFVLVWNKLNRLENGGIAPGLSNDSLFRSLPPNVRLVDMSLSNARNISRYREYSIFQTYSLKKTSSDSAAKKRSGPGLMHRISFFRQSNYYTDAGSDLNFYDSVWYFNGSFTADSFNFTRISNDLAFYMPVSANGTGFRTGLRHEILRFYQEADPVNYNLTESYNLSVHGAFQTGLPEKLQTKLHAVYYIQGYNRNDRNISLTAEKHTGRWIFQALMSTSEQKPWHRYTSMLSNRHRWNATLPSGSQHSAAVRISHRLQPLSAYDAYSYTRPPANLDFELRYTHVNRFPYIALDGNPAVTGDGDYVLQAAADLHLDLRHFQVHERICIQEFSQPLEGVLQLPGLLSKTGIWYQTYAFKQATFIKAGTDVTVTNTYLAQTYDPSLQQFVQGNVTLGAYPVFDLFISAEIKTARVFFRAEHINQDIYPASDAVHYMFASPYHPHAPRRFRLGFTWKFYY